MAQKDTLDPGRPGTQLLNLLKIAGEVVIVPGTSLLMQGKVAQGATHAVLGVLCRVALGTVGGTIGWLVLAANSYSKSSSGTYLHDYVVGAVTSSEPQEVIDVDVTTVPASEGGKTRSAGRSP